MTIQTYWIVAAQITLDDYSEQETNTSKISITVEEKYKFHDMEK